MRAEPRVVVPTSGDGPLRDRLRLGSNITVVTDPDVGRRHFGPARYETGEARCRAPAAEVPKGKEKGTVSERVGSPTDGGIVLRLLLRIMVRRDPGEAYRAATPLELLFDLCFVVAVAQAGGRLVHAVAQGHAGHGVVGYAVIFFAIWWAWMNFTWFATAYDTDDVPYRLVTLVQIAGVLILAAGVPRAFDHSDYSIIVAG
jgi:hypothetical protein